MEQITKEFYYKDLKNDAELETKLSNLEVEGWRIVGAEPIEIISVKIVGRRFILEKSN